MKLLSEYEVHGPQGTGRVQLLAGDLAHIEPEHAVDVLVVSAFPNSYSPNRGTLIGALHSAGISVEKLSHDKEHDLRHVSRCWLSRPVGLPRHNFVRILCFEPHYRASTSAAAVVGDVFRTLVPFVTGEPWVRSVAMPLVASGNQGEPGGPTLQALVDAATHWMQAGLPLECLKIVLFDGNGERGVYIDKMAKLFDGARPKAGQTASPSAAVGPREWDLFISYAHQDGDSVDSLVKSLRAQAPELRLFVDRLALDAGAAWQREIFEAVSSSRSILCLYSPDYLSSRPCLEELHIGMLREREEGGVLYPAYLRSTALPAYMRLVQYRDVREADQARLDELASELIARLADKGPSISEPVNAGRVSPTSPVSATVSVPAEVASKILEGDLVLHIDVTVRFEPRGTSSSG